MFNQIRINYPTLHYILLLSFLTMSSNANLANAATQNEWLIFGKTRLADCPESGELNGQACETQSIFEITDGTLTEEICFEMLRDLQKNLTAQGLDHDLHCIYGRKDLLTE